MIICYVCVGVSRLNLLRGNNKFIFNSIKFFFFICQRRAKGLRDLMDSLRNFQLQKCGLLTLCLALALPTALSSYNVGVGIADTTGPVAEVIFVS